MGGRIKPGHHNLDLKVNFRVLERTTRRLSIKLWPLAAISFFAKVFLNVSGAGSFDAFQDVLFAVWVPLLFMSISYGLIFLALFAGTKTKMRQARNNPGPGKPAREARN